MKKVHLHVFCSLSHDWRSIYIAGSSTWVQDPRAGGRAIFLAEGHFVARDFFPFVKNGRHDRVLPFCHMQDAMWWRLLAGRQSKGLEDVSCEDMDHILEATFAVGKMFLELFCTVEAPCFPLVIGCCAWHSGSSSRVTCQKLIFCIHVGIDGPGGLGGVVSGWFQGKGTKESKSASWWAKTSDVYQWYQVHCFKMLAECLLCVDLHPLACWKCVRFLPTFLYLEIMRSAILLL